MDPVATLRIINDPSEDNDTRLSHLHYLAEFIGKRGMIPIGFSLSDETMQFAADNDSSLLASAVQVAIVNFDLSALEGVGYTVMR